MKNGMSLIFSPYTTALTIGSGWSPTAFSLTGRVWTIIRWGRLFPVCWYRALPVTAVISMPGVSGEAACGLWNLVAEKKPDRLLTLHSAVSYGWDWRFLITANPSTLRT